MSGSILSQRLCQGQGFVTMCRDVHLGPGPLAESERGHQEWSEVRSDICDQSWSVMGTQEGGHMMMEPGVCPGDRTAGGRQGVREVRGLETETQRAAPPQGSLLFG